MKSVVKILFLFFAISFSSCVKDVDVDHLDEIVLSPSAAIDLIYFTLPFNAFVDSSGSPQAAVDELRLEFLDDDYIQTGLKSAEFNVVFRNTLNQPLTAVFKFQSESRNVQYSFSVEIPAGSEASPAVVNHTVIIPEAQIDKIKRSIWLVTEVNLAGPVPSQGELKLESKGLYNFEF